MEPIVVGVGLVLAACSSAAGVQPSVQRPSAFASVSVTTTGPVGSLTNPRVRTCTDGFAHDQDSTGPLDIVAGVLRYPNAQMLARPGSEQDFYGGGVGVGAGGVRFYKMGTYVHAGATVTVRVMPQALAFVRLHGQGSDIPGDQAVTYQACPNGAETSWVGGFDLIDRSAACVPLEVRVKAEPQPRRIVISFFNGVCKVT